MLNDANSFTVLISIFLGVNFSASNYFIFIYDEDVDIEIYFSYGGGLL